MNTSRPQRKTLPYWLALLIGVVLTCILTNAVTASSQFGMFNSWTSLNSPPSGAKKLIDAQYNQIWIEANDGRFFTASILFNCEGKDMCWEWEVIDEVPKMFESDFPLMRASSCKEVRDDKFLSNPDGQIVECVYARFLGPDFWEEGYFALMADGNVLYWKNGGNALGTQVVFILSTVIVPFTMAVIISIIYLIMHIINQRSAEKVHPNP